MHSGDKHKGGASVLTKCLTLCGVEERSRGQAPDRFPEKINAPPDSLGTLS